MKTNILDLIDFERVNSLLEGFNKATGFVTAILDLNGKVLSKSGWRRMCTDFHRINPETSKNCTISDTILAGKLAQGEKYHSYTCLNGLVDVAVPLVIDGEHTANIFLGQFFYEAPDREFFKKQAQKYGFDEEEYLKALENIPVVSQEKVNSIMDFLLDMTQMISEMTFQKQQQTKLIEDLKKSETLFQDLVETSQDLIWQCDAEGKYIYLNPAWEDVLGYKMDEILGKKFTDFQTQEWAERDSNEFERLLKGNTIKGLETIHIGKDGNEISLIFNAKIVYNDKNEVIGTRGSAFNATNIINAERALLEKESQYSSLFNAMNEGVALHELVFDNDGKAVDYRIIELNNAFEKNTGIRITNAKNQLASNLYGPDTAPYLDIYANVGMTGVPKRFETYFAPLKKHFEISVFSPKKEWFATVFTDITDRKHAETLLRDEKEQKRVILEFVGIPIFLKDDQHRIIFANRSFLELFGLDEENILGKTLAEHVPEHERKHFLAVDRMVLDTGIPDFREEELTLGQQTNTIITRKNRFVDESGNKFLVCSIHNITDRKNVEKKLIESENRYRSLFENMTSGFVLFEPVLDDKGLPVDLIIVAANEKFADTTGLKLKDAIGQQLTQVLPGIEKDDANWIETYSKVALSGVACQLEQGSELLGYFYSVTAYQTGSKQCAVLFDDITERKIAEKKLETLLQREKFLGDIIRNASVSVAVGYPDGSLGMFNKAFQQLTGYSKDELKKIKWNTVLTPPEWAEYEAKQLQIINKTKQSLKYEKEYIHKNGHKIPIELLVNPFFDKEGNVTHYFAFITDLTERQQAEKLIQESEKKFSSAFKSSPVALGISKFDGIYIDVNEAFCNLLGYSHDEIINKSSIDLKLFDSNSRNMMISAAIANNGIIKNMEVKLTAKDGSLRHIIYSVEVITIGDEKHRLMTAMDITDRKIAEEALRESSELLRLSSELANVAAWEYDFSTDSMTRSKNHDSLYGLENQEKWAFETFLNATHPDDRELSNTTIQNSVAIGGPDKYKFDFRVVYPDNSIHWLNVIGEVIKRNNKGEGILVRGFLIDITDRKLAEEALKELSANLISTIDNREDSIWSLDRNYNYIIFNKTYENIIYNEHKIKLKKGMDATQLLNEEAAKFWIPKFEKVFEGENITFEFSHKIDGELRHFRTSLNPIIEDNVVTGASGLSIDITGIKQVEKAIIESEEKFKTSFHTNPAAQAILSMQGKFIESNDAFCKLIGFSKEQIIGNSAVDLDLLSLDERNKLTSIAEESGGVIRNAEVKFKIKDGSYRDILYSVDKILINGLTHRLSVGIDITERKQAEQVIKTLNEELEKKVLLRTAQLEASNNELKTFTYSVSHDLKAPLRGIDGYSKLLSDLYKPNLNEEAQSFIETIRRSTQHMNQLIDDLLEYSRMERSEYSMVRINVKDLINSLLNLYRAELNTANIIVNVNIPDIELLADSKGLSIAFRNIFENAIKFTKGRANPIIEIKVEEKELSWIIIVSDNGIGFDMKYHHKIFEIFQRLHRFEDFPGTGIGLALVNKAMQRMNGKVWAESELNKGTTFFLEIPKNQNYAN